MSQAGLIDIEQANPNIPTTFNTDDGSAIPIANTLEILGDTVANGTNAQPVTTTGSGNTVTIEVQLGTAITGAPINSNNAGMVSFDDTQFSVDANGFVQLLGGTEAIDSVTGDDGVAVFPDIAGNINFLGSIVANASNSKPLYFDGTVAANTQTLELQVAATATASPVNSNNAGICSFDDTQFTVDSNGFVQLVGGSGSGAIMKNQGDDGVQVLPDGSGIFYWLGSTVANATHAKPVYFKDSTTPNAIDLDVQVGAAITGAPANKNDAGLASFNDTQFTVDSNGYVELIGGSNLPAIQTLTGDDLVATSPDVNGNIDLTGLTVANGTNAKPVFVNGGTNSEVIEIQVAAAITGAPANKNDAGLCSFDDTDFSVDANGYVTLAGAGAGQTITGDDSVALSPTSGNWNIFGRSGSKTRGSGSTLTVESPPYADSTATTLTINSGTFATAAGAYVLPASPEDGDLCEIVCITTGIIVTANTGQEIQLAGDVSSTAGTATNSAKGDALCLRYRETDTAWYATSVCGVWVLA